MGIKNSTAPVSVSVEHTLKKDGDAWAHSSSSTNPPAESPNGISSHSNGDATNVARIVPESTTTMADWERIVQNFSKLNPISTLVMKAIEVSALSTVIGYIHTLTSSTLLSYEITDDKRNKLFKIQRKTLGFKYAEYQVKTVSAIEVCVLVATVRTPREGKVFTEMRPSLSVTCKALIMSFSLYLLTLNE